MAMSQQEKELEVPADDQPATGAETTCFELTNFQNRIVFGKLVWYFLNRIWIHKLANC